MAGSCEQSSPKVMKGEQFARIELDRERKLDSYERGISQQQGN
jgi:hypothetical protein